MAESHREEIAKLEALYASNPGGRVFVHLAEAYRKAGELERARNILAEGLGRHADSASGFVVLGRVLSDLGEGDEAAGAFRRVLELDAGNLIALRGLGDVARSEGRIGEASEYYRELLSRNPSNEEVRSLLAEVEREAAESPRADAWEDAAADAGEGPPVEEERQEPPAVHPASEPRAEVPSDAEPAGQPIASVGAAPGDAGPVRSPEAEFHTADPDALPGDLASFAGLAPEREADSETADARDDVEAVSLSADTGRELDLQALLDSAIDESPVEISSAGAAGAEPLEIETFEPEDPLDLPALELRSERDASEAEREAEAEFDAALPDDAADPLSSEAFLGLVEAGLRPEDGDVDSAEPGQEPAHGEAVQAESTGGWSEDFPELSLADDETTGDAAEEADPPFGGVWQSAEAEADAEPVFMAWTEDAGEAESLDLPELGDWSAEPEAGEAAVAGFDFDLDAEEVGEAVTWDAPDTDAGHAVDDSIDEPAGAADFADAGADPTEDAGVFEGPFEAQESAQPWDLARDEGEPVAQEAGDAWAGAGRTEADPLETAQPWDHAPTGDAEAPAEPHPDWAEAPAEPDAAGPGGEERQWSGGEVDRGLETETMADLYRSQGFPERAANVYRALLRRRPDDERLAAKLREVTAGGRDDPREEESGDVWLKGVGSTWTAAAPAAGDAPYVWAEPSLAASEPDDEGTPIGSYLQSLATWQPAAPEASQGTARPAEPDAGSDEGAPESQPAPSDETDGPEPMAEQAADERATPDGAEAEPETDPWLAGVQDSEPEPWAVEASPPASPAEPSEAAAPADGAPDDAAFDEWYSGVATAATEPVQPAQPDAAEPDSSSADAASGDAAEPPEAESEDDEDLAMFRSWLQSLKK